MQRMLVWAPNLGHLEPRCPLQALPFEHYQFSTLFYLLDFWIPLKTMWNLRSASFNVPHSTRFCIDNLKRAENQEQLELSMLAYPPKDFEVRIAFQLISLQNLELVFNFPPPKFYSSKIYFFHDSFWDNIAVPNVICHGVRHTLYQTWSTSLRDIRCLHLLMRLSTFWKRGLNH